jgi:propanol-preferring alcohol dehydrogenase
VSEGRVMKAALLYENSKELSIEEVETPKLGSGEALIKVKACGICHTDLNIIDGIIKPLRYPHILGHEIAGVIEDFKPADDKERTLIENVFQETEGRVLIYFYITCGHCNYCLKGESNLCLDFRRIGFEEWGGYAEYVKVPIKNVIPLPKRLDFNAAILVDAGATTYRALRKVKPLPGSTIAIIGVGGLGGMAVQIAKMFGAQVLAIDVFDVKLAYAKRLGADYVLNFNEVYSKNVDEVKRTLRTLGINNSIDAIIDTVGNNNTLNFGMKLIGRGGRIVLLGYGKDKESLNILPIKVIYDEITIMGSRAASMWEVYEVIRLAERGHIILNVTNEYELELVNKAMSDLRSGRILGRAIIKFY